MATTLELLTAEQYSKLPESGRPTELIRGKVVTTNVPAPKHGYICSRVVRMTTISSWGSRHLFDCQPTDRSA